MLDREFGAEIARLEQEIYVDVGHEFNLGSPKQLEQVLFFELNLPKGRKTKTGYSTDASVLEELRPAHPMIDKLLEWRVYTKLRSTYVEALPSLHRRRRPAAHDVPPGRRLDRPPLVVRPEPPEHPDPDRARAADPARVRRGRARPRPARRRLLADRAADPRPRVGRRAPAGTRSRATRTSTARPPPACSARPPTSITHDERSMAKMVNFGLAYGMSDFGLASRANISRAGGAGVHQQLLHGLFRDQLLHDGDQGAGPGPGLRRDAARPQAPDPRAARVATRRCAGRASGWRSTCRSRARPPTSRRSR